ncbi:AbrB/MazE/SpoVT family DNA-binding domain-containing protein [Planococcus sp. X10-3]|uniref:AbrB/MazE/SpoVT family DNA-binding domain-containing protein n=1 Tax=Planococcus sp. X10-3 TaxID=3061240 RepID=UPI003BB21C2A
MAIPEVKLQKWGNSQGIRLPKDLLEQIGVADFKNISFDVQVNGSEITLKPVVKLTPFEQLFEGYDESQPRIQYDWDDEPVGKEIW